MKGIPCEIINPHTWLTISFSRGRYYGRTLRLERTADQVLMDTKLNPNSKSTRKTNKQTKTVKGIPCEIINPQTWLTISFSRGRYYGRTSRLERTADLV